MLVENLSKSKSSLYDTPSADKSGGSYMRTILIIAVLGALTGCSKSSPTPDVSPQDTKANTTELDAPSPAEKNTPSNSEIATALEGWQIIKAQEKFGSNAWIRGVSSNYGFSFEFPGDYSEMALKPTSLTDVKIDMLVHCQKQGYKYDAGTKFSIFVVYFPTSKRPKDSAEALSIASNGMQVIKGPAPVRCGKHDGFEIAVSNTGSSAKIRLFLIGDLVYQMMVETPSADEQPSAEKADRFFNSLISHLDTK